MSSRERWVLVIVVLLLAGLALRRIFVL